MKPECPNQTAVKFFRKHCVVLWLVALANYAFSGWTLHLMFDQGSYLGALGYMVNSLSAIFSVESAIRCWHWYQDSLRWKSEWEAATNQLEELKNEVQSRVKEWEE